MKQKTWEPCPRCGSKKTVYHGKGLYFFIGLIMMSCSIWLLVIPPIGIAGIVIGVIIMLASPLIQAKMACRECSFTWEPLKKQATEEICSTKKAHSKTFWILVSGLSLLVILQLIKLF